MTLDDAMEATVSRAEARAEIEIQHGLCFADFIAECGDAEEYEGADVLNWLGY